MSVLYLIPNVLSEESVPAFSWQYLSPVIASVRCFMTENEKAGRRLLKRIDPQFPIQECVFFELSEHTEAKKARAYFEENKEKDIGIISEAGVPCVADPGAEVVLLAHEHNMDVVPLVGPSSILLALMASGLNGQNFAFNGYLPKDREERLKKLKSLEKRAAQEGQTQIFMETPYRNEDLFEEICSHCHPQTLLTVAANLTGKEQFVKTQTIKQWKTVKPPLHKKPALFLIGEK